MAYSIPSVYQPGFRALAELDGDAYGRLLAFLGGAGPAVDLSDLATRAATETNIPQDQTRQALASVYSLAALREREGASAQEVADNLLLAQLELPEDVTATLRERIVALVDTEAIRLGMRALDLYAADERLLQSARIITDFRPIFPDPAHAQGDDAMRPYAALIVHTLRIEYIEGGEDKTFVVSLDSGDIDSLRDVLSRAGRKARSVGELAEQLGIPVLSPGEGE